MFSQTFPRILTALIPVTLVIGCDADAPRVDLPTASELALAGPSLALPTLALDELSSAVRETAKKPPKPPRPKQAKDRQAADWVRWVMALPYSNGPVNDPDGDACAWGQDGPVWFLAGTGGGHAERECDVPAGKKLVFPLVNQWCVFFPEFFPTEASIEAALPEYLEKFVDFPEAVCSLTLTVDGVDVLADMDVVEDLYVVTEDTFDIEVNEDHFASSYGIAGGPMTAITGGFYVRLKPLAPGNHVIELGGSLCDGGTVVFDTSATYNLHVGG